MASNEDAGFSWAKTIAETEKRRKHRDKIRALKGKMK